MNLKKPLDYPDLIKKLCSYGMQISNENEASNFLHKNSYYRFTGYALQFRSSMDENKYIKGTNFDVIKDLCVFDAKLRNILRKYIEIVEVYYRNQIAHIFSIIKCNTPPHDQHYLENSFYNKKGYKNIKETFDKERKYYEDTLIVQHHNIKYNGKMPLWVMVEFMSFSNLSKLFSAMYFSDQKRIASVVGISNSTLANHLHCLSVLRNKCAHAARLYNTLFNPPVSLNKQFLKSNPKVSNNKLFAYILVLFKRLPCSIDQKQFLMDIDKLINEYAQVIDMDILGIPSNYVKIFNNNIKC